MNRDESSKELVRKQRFFRAPYVMGLRRTCPGNCHHGNLTNMEPPAGEPTSGGGAIGNEEWRDRVMYLAWFGLVA